MDEEEQGESIITCLAWVPQGFATGQPRKYDMNDEELARITAQIDLHKKNAELDLDSAAAVDKKNKIDSTTVISKGKVKGVVDAIDDMEAEDDDDDQYEDADDDEDDEMDNEQDAISNHPDMEDASQAEEETEMEGKNMLFQLQFKYYREGA